MGAHGSSPSYSGSKAIMLFIDGTYLRKQFKDLFGHDNINFQKVAESVVGWVTRGTLSPQLVRAYYYEGFLTLEQLTRMNLKDEDMDFGSSWINDNDDRREYLDRIRKTDYFDVQLGSLRISNQKTQQKGVDVLLSIDMISKAYEHQYDEAVLIAGDSDFIKVVESVKRVGATVLGIYFENHASAELLHAFDVRKKLTKNEILSWELTT